MISSVHGNLSSADHDLLPLSAEREHLGIWSGGGGDIDIEAADYSGIPIAASFLVRIPVVDVPVEMKTGDRRRAFDVVELASRQHLRRCIFRLVWDEKPSTGMRMVLLGVDKKSQKGQDLGMLCLAPSDA